MSPAVFDYIIKMVCCVFAAGILIYVFYPSRDTDTGIVKTRAAYLYERKEVVYENLRDLSFEFKSGKFTQADYDGMRMGLEAEAARIMAEIEVLESARA
ncbi:MAG: hypothetical protein JWM83_1295 [Candidatus Angelobacter sp.]|jgi:hypothetical protein|nr:hypothetical protein [Candidatus Angelobacter sp.]MCU1254996.1 hypothetical protein [Candidatus Angelobacter sp.]